MVVDLQSLFGVHVTRCAQLYSLAETPQLQPSPRIWTRIMRAQLVSKDRRHLFVTPWKEGFSTQASGVDTATVSNPNVTREGEV